MPINIGDNISYSSGNVATDYTSTSTTNSINAENRESKVCRYPLKRIENGSDYLMIKVVKYEPTGLKLVSSSVTSATDANGEQVQSIGITDETDPSTESTLRNIGSKTANERLDLKKLKYLIYLPVPQSVTDSMSVTWGEDRLSPLDAFGLSFGSDAIQNPKLAVEKYFNLVKTKIISSAADADMQKALISAIAGQAYSGLGGNVTATGVVSRATGQILNPNMELLFDGVNLRSFSFTFDMVARSKAEGAEIKKIIKIFKKSMSARSNANDSAKAGVFVSAPDVFQLEYRKGNSKHPFLNRFLPSALLSCDVNYTGSNTYATYWDGTPVHIQMTLNFQELNPIYFEDYERLENEGDQSVGY